MLGVLLHLIRFQWHLLLVLSIATLCAALVEGTLFTLLGSLVESVPRDAPLQGLAKPYTELHLGLSSWLSSTLFIGIAAGAYLIAVGSRAALVPLLVQRWLHRTRALLVRQTLRATSCEPRHHLITEEVECAGAALRYCVEGIHILFGSAMYFVIIASFAPGMALFAFACISLFILSLTLSFRHAHGYGQEYLCASQDLFLKLSWLDRNRYFLRTHKLEDFINSSIDNALNRSQRASQHEALFHASYLTVRNGVGLLLFGGIFFSGTYLFQVPRDQLVSFMLIFMRLSQRLGQFAGLGAQLFSLIPALTRVVSDLQSLDKSSSGSREERTLPSFGRYGTLSIINLAHYYGDTIALSPFSITMNTEETLYISGESGCGKTTFALLLAGLIEYKHGLILYNGSQISPQELRRNAIYLGSETPVLQCSVWENLRCVASGTSDETIVQTLALVQLLDVVSELPDKLHTQLGAEQPPFSRGELQRLALARAILAKPSLLILDEALSGVSPDQAEALISNLSTCNIPFIICISHHRSSSSLQIRLAPKSELLSTLRC